MKFFFVLAFSFSLSIVLTPIVRYIALRLKILDIPDNNRKIHTSPIPLLGGVAIAASFYITLLLNFSFSWEFKGVVLGAFIIGLVGTLDDMFGLSASFRFLVQIFVALFVTLFNIKVTFLPNTWWGVVGEYIITVLWIVGVTNAVNFIDGLDGLAVGLTSISCLFFFIIAQITHQVYLAYISLSLLGASLGFLCFNFHPAKIFLGDGGALFLGFILAGLGIMGEWQRYNFVVALSIPCLILSVPIYDIIYITVERILTKKVKNIKDFLEYVGKDHLHHRLMNLGFSQIQTVLFIYALGAVFGISALVLRDMSTPNCLLTILQALLLYVILSFIMMRR